MQQKAKKQRFKYYITYNKEEKNVYIYLCMNVKTIMYINDINTSLFTCIIKFCKILISWICLRYNT